MRPKVSIIIPVYNTEKYLSKNLDSLINQTFECYEIIAINDGSTDNSLNILNEYKEKSNRLRVFSRENRGVAATRNEGILFAQGDYILFVDSDDYISNDYVKTFFDGINNSDFDILIGGMVRVNTAGEQLYKIQLSDEKWSKYRLIFPSSRIYRKTFLLDEELRFRHYPLAEDLLFSIEAYTKTSKIKTIPYLGYFWLYNENSASNTVNKGFNPKLSIVELFDNILTIVPEDYSELEYIKFFIEKFSVYWLLDGGRQSTRREFLRQFNLIQDWIDKNKMKSSYTVFNRQVKSERITVKLAMLTFTVLKKFHLVGLFSRIYCKGK